MHKNILASSIGFALLASALLTGCGEAQQAAAGAMPPTAVDVVTLKTAPLQLTTELTGRTAARRIAEVRPQVSGIILKRYFTEGSDVRAGQLLYQIDPATYEAAVASADDEDVGIQRHGHAETTRWRGGRPLAHTFSSSAGIGA